jgi:hypothetical protein
MISIIGRHTAASGVTTSSTNLRTALWNFRWLCEARYQHGHASYEAPVSHLSVIRAVVAICQPIWLAIRNFAQFTDNAAVDNALLSFDSANLEASVLRSGDDVVPVKAIESLSGVLSSFKRVGRSIVCSNFNATYQCLRRVEQMHLQDANS